MAVWPPRSVFPCLFFLLAGSHLSASQYPRPPLVSNEERNSSTLPCHRPPSVLYRGVCQNSVSTRSVSSHSTSSLRDPFSFWPLLLLANNTALAESPVTTVLLNPADNFQVLSQLTDRALTPPPPQGCLTIDHLFSLKLFSWLPYPLTLRSLVFICLSSCSHSFSLPSEFVYLR